MINAPPTFDWAGRDPAADLTAALTANNWQQDYDAGITVDAEFSGAAGSFPADPARLGASPKDSPANGTSARAEGTQARTLFHIRETSLKTPTPVNMALPLLYLRLLYGREDHDRYSRRTLPARQGTGVSEWRQSAATRDRRSSFSARA